MIDLSVLFHRSSFHTKNQSIINLLAGNLLARFNPGLKQLRSLATIERSTSQLAPFFDRFGQPVDVASYPSIQNDGITLGIGVISTFQYLLKLFGILLGTASLQINQLASRNTYRLGVKLEFLSFVNLWFSGSSRIFDLPCSYSEKVKMRW